MNSKQPKKTCTNCGEKLIDKFCHKCGQKDAHLNVSIKELITAFLGDIFTFDTRFFRSLLPLFFKPGFLTKEWIAGYRVRYIPPLRLYIFVSIISFLLFRSLVSIAVYTPNPLVMTSENQNKNTYTIILFGAKSASHSDPHINNFSTIMFILLPVFALILKGLYYRTRRFYIQHLIFALHIHSFSFLFNALLYAFLYMIFFALADAKYGLRLTFFLVVFLMLPIYLYLSMKYVYGDSRGKTFAKLVGLVAAYSVVFAFSFLATAYMTANL